MAPFRYAQIEADLPEGWEARGFAREEEVSGERTYAVLHLANFPLPARVEDYGGGAVEAMRLTDVFVSLLEFGAESLGTPLFGSSSVPTLTRDSFDPNLLQRALPRQSAAQVFFTANRRPYCLYVVLGEQLMRLRITPVLNGILRNLRFAT